MSKTIDEKVVEMRFDNKQFESNVQTSLSTLDKLKRSLNLDGATKGLENVSTAANNCNMSGLRGAVETVHAKFSAFEVMAVTALANITNSVINTGKQMLRSLSVEPISQGFQEYELKMGSIQTIMASTGESLDTVNKYLNELNTYADKTIYSFSDMTTNIGKFTNAGVKLEDAVKAIQGISNEAAVSGANANEASRAMYNFAQALSAGYVKLIDWKSIENANMATVEFKNQLLETALALGTVVKVGDKYQTTTTDAKGKVSELFDATHNFNDALSAQWMTTDVLVKTLGDYADETTEIGKKAFAAAQDVKTFTQLMDTLKEAAGSGWATTWEIVFGNFDEAKELWTSVSTVVGGFIDAQADARNSLLQGWKDLGGRTKLIEALKNAFEGLVSIVKPIGEAFREIFPKTTAEQLYSITQSLSNFAARLKLSDEASANLKSTFKGLFAVLDIVKQAFSAVFKAISPLFGGLDDLGGGILGVTGKMGNWLVKLDDVIKKSNIFNKALQGVVSFIQSIPGKINGVFQSITGTSLGEAFDTIREKASSFLEKMKEIFGGFGKIDTKGIDTLTEKTTSAFKPLTTLFDGIKKVFSGIWEFLKKLAPIFTSIASSLGKALGGVGMSVAGALKNADFEKIFELINGGVLVSIGVGIKKFVDSLTSVTKNASGFIDSLKGILDGVKGSFEAWQKDIKANALLKIAGAVGILTLSLVVLSGIDGSKLYDALASITTLFIELAAAMAAMSKIGKVSASNSVGMIAMSVAVLVLASALKKLSGLDLKGVTTGLVGIAGLSAILVIVAKQLSKSSGPMIKGAVGLIAFAAAIRLMVKPVKELGSLDIASLTKGLVGVGVLCAELVLFLKTADLDKMSLGKGLGLMALAEGINILAKAVSKFAALDITSLIKGLAGVGVVLAEIAAFMKLTNNSKGLLSTAIGMTVLGAAMLIFGKAISNIGNLSWEEIAKGLVGIGVALVGVAAAMKLMPDGAKMISAGAGMVLVGASMKIFASAISSLSGMSWGELAKGLTAMALALAEVVITMKLMDNKALAGASAVLVCAAALGLFVPVLKALGGMSCGEIAKGLLTVAGVFVILGAAGYILKPVVGTILSLSAAMALIGVAAVAFGAGLLAISVALSAFAGSAAILVAAIVEILIGLVTAIPDIVTALAKSLGEALPAIIECIVAVAKAALLALNEVVPLAVEVLLNIVQEVLASLAAHIQGIVESLLQIIVGILEGLAAGIPQVIASAIKLFKAILDAIFEAIGGFDIGTILTATAALTALAAMMTLITVIAAEAVVATAVLPLIGMNLNKFIENAQPFLAEIQKVDAASLQGAKNLAETVLMLTAAGIMDALTSWFTGGKSFIKFGEQLAEFAPYLKQYYLGIKGIDAGVVEASANAAKALGEMATHLPNSGGVLGFLAGENDMDEFGRQLIPFGKAMKEFSIVVAGMDGGAVENAANAGKAVSEMAKTLPNSGGVLGFFAGENDMDEFGRQLIPFGKAMKEFSIASTGINPEVITNAATAGKALSEMAATLPNTGGVVGWFTGENDMDVFGEQLVPFGKAIKSFSLEIAGMDAGSVTNAATAGKTLAEMAATLPNTGGVVGWFTGENDMAAFGEQLIPFGKAMKDFSLVVSGIDGEAVTNAATAGLSLAEMAATLPNTGGVVSWFTGNNDMDDFGEQIIPFGRAMKSYSDAVSGIDIEAINNSATAGKALVELAKTLPNTGGVVTWFTGDNDIGTFGDHLKQFGQAFAQYANYVKDVDPNVITATANAGQSLVSLANSLPNTGGIVSWFTGDNDIGDFGESLKAFGSAFAGYYDYIQNVNASVLSAVVKETSNLISLAKGMSGLDTKGMSSFGEALKKLGQGGIDAFINAFNNSMSKVKETASKMLSTFSNEATSKKSTITNSFTSIVQEALTALNSKQSQFQNAGAQIMGKFIDGIKSKLSSVKTQCSTLISNCLTLFKNKYSEFKSVGQQSMSQFISGISSKSENVKSAFTSNLNGAVTAIKNHYNDFKSAGSYLVDGFAAGITSNTYKAEAKAKAMAKAAANAARKELNEHSPSKVGYEIGDYFGIAFVNALDDYASKAYSSGSEIAESAKSGLSNAISKVTDLINGEIDTQPTIRPVLDLSDVERGTSRINSLFSRSQALSVNAEMSGEGIYGIQNGASKSDSGTQFNFTQNNYSPKALSRIDIYRQTKNQFAAMKEAIEKS